jgi:hypothetical protein
MRRQRRWRRRWSGGRSEDGNWGETGQGDLLWRWRLEGEGWEREGGWDEGSVCVVRYAYRKIMNLVRVRDEGHQQGSLFLVPDRFSGAGGISLGLGLSLSLSLGLGMLLSLSILKPLPLLPQPLPFPLRSTHLNILKYPLQHPQTPIPPLPIAIQERPLLSRPVNPHTPYALTAHIKYDLLEQRNKVGSLIQCM